MLLRVCTVNRKRHLVVVKNHEEFIIKVKQVLALQGDFHCVLEEDGTEISIDVMEAIFEANEKVGLIMVLLEGEQWAPEVTLTNEVEGTTIVPPTLPLQQQQNDITAHGTANKKSFQDVRTVLGKSAKGQKVLSEYDRHQTLCSESRQTLVKIAVAQLVDDCGPYPSKDQKMQLGLAIITSLPGLKDAAGVTGFFSMLQDSLADQITSLPGLKDAAGVTGFEHFFHESAGQAGYIQDRLKRVRRSLSSDQQQRPRKQLKQSTRLSSPVTDGCDLPCGEPLTQELSTADLDSLVLDCKYANPATDRAQILSAMSKTAASRQQWIRADKPSITEVLNKYPRMEDVPLDLLDIDFRVHFPAAVDVLCSEFPKWVKGIIGAARLSHRSDLADLLREYDTEEHLPNLNERDILYSILCLLQLLPSSNTRQKGKVSSVELERSLITFKAVQTSIDLFTSEKKQTQPFLLCIGSKEEPGVFYLLLDTKAVCLGTCGILRALDCLFKSHYVYWVGYAKPIAFFMEFIQKLIYKIECTKLSSKVRELHSSILAINSKFQDN